MATLYEYLCKNPQKKVELARKLRIAESSLYKYINQEREPKLGIAIRIHAVTKGLVTFKDMLLDPQEAEITVEPIEIIEETEIEDSDLL